MKHHSPSGELEGGKLINIFQWLMLILCVQLIFSGLSSERSRFITYACIEKGNPSDKDLFVPVLNAHQENYDDLLEATVADGGYASQANISKGRDL